MPRIAFMLAALLALMACGGTKGGEEGARLEPDKEKLIDALTMFVEAVQADRFDKALGYLTPAEKSLMTSGSGIVSTPVQRQLKALRLSTLANKSGVRLDQGKLEGIHPWLPNLGHAPGETPRDSIPPPLLP
jgi:hypothetical protein